MGAKRNQLAVPTSGHLKKTLKRGTTEASFDSTVSAEELMKVFMDRLHMPQQSRLCDPQHVLPVASVIPAQCNIKTSPIATAAHQSRRLEHQVAP